MTSLPFPDQQMVSVAADAVLTFLRTHPHIYPHSLRYLSENARKETAERIARLALFTAWLLPDRSQAIPDFNRQMQRLADILEESVSRARTSERKQLSPGDLRRCRTCEMNVKPVYRDCALRCPVCDTVTLPLLSIEPQPAAAGNRGRPL